MKTGTQSSRTVQLMMGLPDVNVIFDVHSNRLVIDLFRRISLALVITHPRNDYLLDHEQTHLLARRACFAYVRS